MSGWLTVTLAVATLLFTAYACCVSWPPAVRRGKKPARAFSTAASATTTLRSEILARSLRDRVSCTASCRLMAGPPGTTVTGPVVVVVAAAAMVAGALAGGGAGSGDG